MKFSYLQLINSINFFYRRGSQVMNFFLMEVVKLFLKWQNLITKLVVTLNYNFIQYLFYWKRILTNLPIGLNLLLISSMLAKYLKLDARYVEVKYRGVHGSVRVGFVPNPRPTRRTRVKNVLTRRRPARESDWSGRFFARNTVGSVETVHGEKSDQNSWFQAKMR